YYNVPTMEATKKALDASGMDRIFFTNSGTEAIEGALKAAKKYAYTRDGHANHEVIAMEHSFHGRSLGALSGDRTETLPGTVRRADSGESILQHLNDLDSVKASGQ
ncbi:MAG: aminotransferase class III-fold pyridoxal phosphate-dependent enzyme, partial [Eubacterium sp.]